MKLVREMREYWGIQSKLKMFKELLMMMRGY